MRGRAWRYPDRKRCLACRGYFGFTVLDGLYCSARCARVPEISADPADWPREHFSLVPHSGGGGGVRKAKKGYLDRRAAISAARRWGKKDYQCGYCLEYHIGSSDPAKNYAENRVQAV
jgi:hypothetical protein